MPLTLVIFIIIIAIALIVVMAWRISGRFPIPCPTWLGWVVEMDSPVFKNHDASEIIQHSTIQSGMKVLDFGCGPGRLTIPVTRQVGPTGSVTAFDIQPGMLERVRRKASQAGLTNIEYVQGSAGEGKLERNGYDRVLLVTVLGEIPDKVTAIQEIFECLKPGGLLSITEIIMDPHFQTRRKVQEVTAAAGFREVGFFGRSISYTIIFEKPA